MEIHHHFSATTIHLKKSTTILAIFQNPLNFRGQIPFKGLDSSKSKQVGGWEGPIFPSWKICRDTSPPAWYSCWSSTWLVKTGVPGWKKNDHLSGTFEATPRCWLGSKWSCHSHHHTKTLCSHRRVLHQPKVLKVANSQDFRTEWDCGEGDWKVNKSLLYTPEN